MWSPERYLFQLAKVVYDRLRSQNVTLKRSQHVKYFPYAFTEHSILMLANVIKSERALNMSIKIIGVFFHMCEME